MMMMIMMMSSHAGTGISYPSQIPAKIPVSTFLLTIRLLLMVSLNVAEIASEELPFSATVFMLNFIGKRRSTSSTNA